MKKVELLLLLLVMGGITVVLGLNFKKVAKPERKVFPK